MLVVMLLKSTQIGKEIKIMAWFTTDDGRKVNTDWFDADERKKYQQMEQAQEEAKKAANQEGGNKLYIDPDEYKIHKVDAEALENFLRNAADAGYDEDSTSLDTNITKKNREKLAEYIQNFFKEQLGWTVQVNIRRKVEAGNRSKLKNGGSTGKIYWTVISYKQIDSK